jgi:hypothetical protein
MDNKNHNVRRSLRIYENNMNKQLQNDKNNMNMINIKTFLESNQKKVTFVNSINRVNINSQKALKSIQEIVSQYPQTRQCVGNNITDWFQTLVEKKILEQNVQITEKFDLNELDGDNIKKIIQVLKENPDYNIIIPLSYQKHSNLIFVNRQLCIIEWFEPHGDLSGEEDYDFKLNFLIHDFIPMFEIPSIYKIKTPYDQCLVKTGPQTVYEGDDKKCLIGGYCLTYSTIYAHLRCLTSQVDPSETIQILQNLSNEDNIDLVRRYIGWQNDLGHKDIYSLMGNTKENANKRRESVYVKSNILFKAYMKTRDQLFEQYEENMSELNIFIREKNKTILDLYIENIKKGSFSLSRLKENYETNKNIIKKAEEDWELKFKKQYEDEKTELDKMYDNKKKEIEEIELRKKNYK